MIGQCGASHRLGAVAQFGRRACPDLRRRLNQRVAAHKSPAYDDDCAISCLRSPQRAAQGRNEPTPRIAP